MFIQSAEIYLNLEQLDTKELVQKGIAHEIAHLFPTGESFETRWKRCIEIVQQVARLVGEEE